MSSNDAPAKLSQMADSISVKGAREHNLKTVSYTHLTLPTIYSV